MLQSSHLRVVSADHPLLVETLTIVELGIENAVNLQRIVKLATYHRPRDKFCSSLC